MPCIDYEPQEVTRGGLPVLWGEPEVCETIEELEQWNLTPAGVDWYAYRKPVQVEERINDPLRQLFTSLVAKWRDQTCFVSSIKKHVSHAAYLQIIGLGPVAIPWILEELEHTPEYWYAALEALTRQDPAPKDADLPTMREAWLKWGRAYGYI